MKIQLSISLLASNRAESLERCLDSLRPLLMQVPSELIIVFTGTDERVREIASRYTDKILPFTWCGNFSAARNVGLWAAKGEWFMYIDDDEWFEDVAEIRDFFLTGEYRSFGSGFYKQKNYTGWDGIRYSDYHAFRMARIVPGMAFQNTVHEELVPRMDPSKYFNTYVNHYGYVSDTGKSSVEKSSRNLPLLLQNIQERPSYVKNYLQIVQEYIIKKDWEKAGEYCRKGLRLCKGYEDNFYRSWLQANLMHILCGKKDYGSTEKEALSILEKEQPWELVRLELYTALLTVYIERGASEEILRYGKKFEETLAYMDQHPQLWSRQSYGGLTEGWIKDSSRLDPIRINCIESALKMEDVKEAQYFLALLPWEEETWMQQYYPYFDKWKKLYGGSFQELLSAFPEQSPYSLLQRATAQAGEEEAPEKCKKYFSQCMAETGSVYLQYQAIKEAVVLGVNISEMVNQLDLGTWKQCVENVRELIPAGQEEKLQEAAEKLCRDAPIYGFWLERLLLERELLRGYLPGERLMHCLEKYIECILQFYRIQYRDEMFGEEKCSLLPKDCRFALCVSEALGKIKGYAFPEAVRLLRRAIRFYPEMTAVIREVIRQMTAKIENPVQNRGEEFQMLALQMKDALRAMITNGQYAEALPVILQLSSLLPEDLELLRMRQNVLWQTAE